MRIPRTTISCVALAFFVTTHAQDLGAVGLTFPLEEKWMATLDAPPSFPPAYDATQAYIALRNNHLVSISLQTGKPVWSVERPITAGPAAGDGFVFLGGDSFLEARSNIDGVVRWRTTVEGPVTSVFWETGWLIAGNGRGAIVALHAQNGEVIWRRDLDAALQTVPAPAGARVYLSLQNGKLMAILRETGDALWTVQLPKAGSGLLALDDRIFVGSLDNRFYSLSAKRGDVMWSWRTGADVRGAPVVDSRHVYFVSLDNVLRALDRKNGSVRWQKSLPMRPSTGPMLSGGTLIVAGVSTELHAFAALDGKPSGDLVLKSPQGEEMQFAAPPHLTADAVLIVLSRGGQMQALTSPPPAPTVQ